MIRLNPPKPLENEKNFRVNGKGLDLFKPFRKQGFSIKPQKINNYLIVCSLCFVNYALEPTPRKNNAVDASFTGLVKDLAKIGTTERASQHSAPNLYFGCNFSP